MSQATEQKHIEYLELVNQIALELASVREPSQVLSLTQQRLSDLDCWLMIGLVEEGSLVFGIPWEDGVKETFRLEIQRGISGRSVRTRQPQFVPDVSCDPDYVAYGSEDVRAEYAYPLVIRGEVLGVLDIQSSQPHFFAEEDTRFFAVLANHLAVALDNALTHQTLALRTEELANANERLRHVLASAHCLLWHADIEQKAEDFIWDTEVSNVEAARQFLPLHIPPGHSYVEAWHISKLDGESVNQYGQQVLVSGATEYTQEYRCRRVDGEIRWLHERAQVQQVAPQRWHVVGVCTDITERKQMEQRLSENESRYHNIIALADGVAYQRSWLDNTYVFMDEGIEHLTGYSSEEITPEIFESLVEEETLESSTRSQFFHDEMSKQIGGESATRYQSGYRLKARDGRTVWVTDSALQVRNEMGQLVEALGMLQDVTRHVQIELAFRNIARSIPMGMHMYQLDPENRLVLVHTNPAADEVLGIDHDPLIGKTIENVLPALADTEVPAHYRRVASEGGNWQTQHLNYRDEHVVAILEVYAFQISPGNVAALFTDIAGRKQAEEDQRESEERYRTLFQTMAQGVVYQDANGAITSANPAAERILGLSLSQMQGRTSMDPRWRSIHKDGSDFPGGTHPAMVALRTGKPARNVTMGVFHPSRGDYRWININATPQFRQGEDRPYQVYATFEDITERINAEIALRESEERYRGLVEGASQPIFTINRDGVFLFMNRGAASQLGGQAEDFVGKNMWDLFPKEIADVQIGEIRKALDTGQLVSASRESVVAGERRWYEARIHPYGDTDGVYDRAIIILTDITEQKQAEEHQSALQARAEEQQKLAAIGQLAAGIAHDFNNILSGVLGHAEMAQMSEELPNNVQHSLQVIHQQGQRAAELVQQILDFSRKSIQQKHPLGLVRFLSEKAGLLERILPDNIQVSLAYTAGDYTVNADAAQLQQVLTNLAANAMDAMPDGGRLRIQLGSRILNATELPSSTEAEPGDWVTISVSDSGCGIPAEILPHIYEPFFTTKEVGQGSGLGLSQVYGIVQQHGGFIEVESEINEGTTFVIYLPVPKFTDGTMSNPVPPAIPRGQGETVLVVEDNSTVLDVVKSMLNSLGYNVLAARDGAEALGIFEQHQDRIPVVLTDVVMPRVGGLELHRLLHQVSADTKVILISGYPLGDDAQQLYADGIVGWVQKPISMSKLAQELSQALQR